MEKDKKTNLEDWLADGIKEVGLESPSKDFTHQVLSKLAQKQSTESKIIYSPLISKNGWAVVAGIILAIFGLSFYGETDVDLEKNAVLGKVSDFLSQDFFSGIQFSDTVVMGTVIFALFASIQIAVLKRFIERNHI